MRRSKDNPLLVGDLVIYDLGNVEWLGNVVRAEREGHQVRYQVIWGHSPGSSANTNSGGWWCGANEVMGLTGGSNPRLTVVQVDSDQR